MDNEMKDNNMFTNETYEANEEKKITENIYDENLLAKDNFKEKPMIDNNYREKQNKERKRGRGPSYFITALVAALIGGMLGAYIFPVFIMGKIDPIPQQYTNENIYQGSEINISTNNDVYYAVAVTQKAKKTVVGITTYETYNDYFGEERQVEGMGSGVIVKSDGYILTNSHVIADGRAEKITVLFEDGSRETGAIKWYDTVLDLAIIKVEKTGLPVAEFGDSDELVVGEPVVAIGNPLSLELDRTVTAGIVSGLNRSLQIDANTVIEPLIQTDASINPGNSGGPLLNASGKVIGINTAKMKSSEGLGFSIPINTAKPLLEQVINGEEISSVYIGIRGIEVAGYEKALNVDISAGYGVVVVEIMKNSPSFTSSLQAGDVIQKIDDKKIENMNDLKRKLYDYKDGDEAKVTIYRNGDILIKSIIFKEKPNNY